MRQNLVVNLNQFKRIARIEGGCGRNGRHCMPIIKRFFPRHHIFQNIPKLACKTAFKRYIFGKIRAGHYSFDAFHGLSFAGVYGKNAGMCVRRAQNRRVQHTGCRHIRTEFGAACDFVKTIGTIGAGADIFEVGCFWFIQSH